MILRNAENKGASSIRIFFGGACILWFVTLLGLFSWGVLQTHEASMDLAGQVAKTHFDKDRAFRLWGTSHGGVYVPVDARTPPNPHLPEIPERDIQTPSGKHLSLMNPAYMMRQLHEEFSELYGVRGRITSLKPLRPQNSPDAWEKKALESFEHGGQGIKEFTEIDGEPYLRVMMPFMTEKGCLKCHAEQGYREGDVRGGIGISLPLKPFLRQEHHQIWSLAISHSVIFLLGFVGLFIGKRKLEKEELKRNAVQESLRESDENFRTFFDTLDDMVVIGTPDGRIIHTNPAMCQKLGYGPGGLEEKHILDVHPEELRKEAERIFAEMFRGGRDICPLPLKTKSGTLVPVETRCWLGKWSGVDCIFGVCKDLSKEQEALQKFDRLFRNNPALMAVSTLPDRKFSDVNDSFLNTLGFTGDEIIGKASADLRLFVQPKIQQSVAEDLERYGRVSGVELKVRCKDGTVLDGLFSGEIIESQGRKMFLTVMVDISRQKQVEEALKESEARYRFLADQANDIIWTTDLNMRTTYVSPSIRKVLGFTPEERMQQGVEDQVTAESLAIAQQRLCEELTRVRKQGTLPEESIVLDLDYHHKNGSVVCLESVISFIRDKEGSPIGVHGLSRDITDRKRAEKTLRDQKEFLNTVIESLAHPFYIVNANDYTIERVNSSALSVGITTNSFCYEATHRTNAPCGGDDHPCPLEEVKKTRQPVTAEHIHIDEKGQRRNVEVHCFPIPDSKGMVQQVIEYFLDITDRKKAQEALVQAEKFRAVVDLTSGIAHNFNNLLQIILGNANLGMFNLQSGNFTDLKENLDQIVESSKFGAETVRRLNRYASGRQERQPANITVFDMSDLVRQAVEMSKPWWKNESEKHGIRVSLTTRLKDDCTIRGDKNDMFEVLVNLIKNAVEALPTGGDIEIDTGHAGDRVILSIRDTGIGIPKENLSRLFTPFFTTNVEAGRGLGLATCRRIIDSHGGTIHVESIEGRGSTFTITLPVVPEEPRLVEFGEDKTPQRVLTILAVDDMEATVKMLRAGLETFGHTVLTALSGEEALSIFPENPIDLVICDLGMPGMTGWEVGRAIKEICKERGNPKPAFIMLTGWEDQSHQKAKITASGVDAVVQKPVEMTKLLEVIWETVEK